MSKARDRAKVPQGFSRRGHHGGRRIVAILRNKGTEMSDEDYVFMRKIVGFVARRAQEEGLG